MPLRHIRRFQYPAYAVIGRADPAFDWYPMIEVPAFLFAKRRPPDFKAWFGGLITPEDPVPFEWYMMTELPPKIFERRRPPEFPAYTGPVLVPEGDLGHIGWFRETEIPPKRRYPPPRVPGLGLTIIVPEPVVVEPPARLQKPPVPRVPDAPERLRRHTEIVQAIINDLVRRGFIVRVGINEWTLQTGALVQNRAPTVNDDITVGVYRGQIWLDEISAQVWINLIDTPGAAVWIQLA